MQKKLTGEIVNRLRDLMASRSNTKWEEIKAYVIPSRDAHANQYVAPCDERIAYISGFTGAYATCVITQHHALLWTDGRFYTQASMQLDDNWILMKSGVVGTPSIYDWLMDTLPVGSKVGVDPNNISFRKWIQMEDMMQISSITLVPLEKNLVDMVWKERPARVKNPIFPHPLVYSGKRAQDKLSDIWQIMKKKRVSIVVVSALDEIAWCLNLRGSDIVFNPFFFAYMLVIDNSFILFVDKGRITDEIKEHLDKEVSVPYTIEAYEDVFETLKKKSRETDGFIWCSRNTSYSMTSMVPMNKLFMDTSPISLKKLVKTQNEIDGMKKASARAGAAITSLLHYIETNIKSGTITEYSAIEKLNEYRSKLNNYVSPAVITTSAFGPNTSIKHYTPSKDKARTITEDDIYLMDAGTQFKDGTTDLTRTMHFGTPLKTQQVCFTRALKGHIALSRAIFPEFTKGSAIDIFARKFLWESGFDYPHRTGHGIGAFLSSHEAPLQIGKQINRHEPGLEAGMFVTNEPVNRLNNTTLRLENIMLVVKVNMPHKQTTNYLGFEPITLCPIQKKLIAMDMITYRERFWLDNYHELCRLKITPYLERLGHTEVIEWLNKNTEPINVSEAIYAT